MDDDIASYLTTWPPDLSPQQAAARIAAAQQRLADREAVEFAIIRSTTEQLIGWISFVLECPKSGEATIGFWLGRKHQGQGYMTEAAEAAMLKAADFLRMKTIDAYVYPWNSASVGLVRKLGFWPEGGAALYSPVRGRTEEAFLYRRRLEANEITHLNAIQLEQ